MQCPYCGAKSGVATPGDEGKIRCDSCGNFYLEQRDASTETPEAITPDEEKLVTAQRLLEEGLALEREKKLSSAIIKLLTAAENAPARIDILMALGRVRAKNNLHYEAQAAYRKILKIAPDNTEALFKLGVLLIQQRNYREGIAALESILSLEPDSKPARLMISIAQTDQTATGMAQTPAPTHKPVSETSNYTVKFQLAALLDIIKSASRPLMISAIFWLTAPVIFVVAHLLLPHDPVTIRYLMIAMTIFVVFFSVVIHELGHGLAALSLDDDTASLAGRITLNPLRHVSITGALIVPAVVYVISGVAFGWAKPMPFNPLRFRRQPRDQALMAMAGPFASLALSFIMFAGFLLVSSMYNGRHSENFIRFTANLATPFEIGAGLFDPLWFVTLEIFALGAVINLIIAIFNLIPAPPLDGAWLLKAASPSLFGVILDRGRWISFAVIVVGVYTGWISALLYPVKIVLLGYYYISGMAVM